MIGKQRVSKFKAKWRSYLYYFNDADERGSPVWNEKFTFRAEYPGSGDDFKIILKILDHDTFSADDFIGQTS